MRGTCFSAWIGRPNPEPNLGMIDDDVDAFLASLECAFDISLKDVSSENLRTLADLQAIILHKTSAFSAERIWGALTQYAREQCPIAEHHIAPTVHLYERVYV